MARPLILLVLQLVVGAQAACEEKVQHAWAMPCFPLWVLAIWYSWKSFTDMKAAVSNAKDNEAIEQAREDWGRRKCTSFVIFIICTAGHFLSFLWMIPSHGQEHQRGCGATAYIMGMLAPCFVLGVIIPVLFCCNGDKALNRLEEQRRRELSRTPMDLHKLVE